MLTDAQLLALLSLKKNQYFISSKMEVALKSLGKLIMAHRVQLSL